MDYLLMFNLKINYKFLIIQTGDIFVWDEINIYVPGYDCLSSRLDISIQDRSHCTSVASCLVAGKPAAARSGWELGQQP